MLLFLLSVVVISLSGVMLPGPMFAVTVAKGYRSQSAGALVALGHILVEVPLILLIYFGLAPFFQEDIVKLALNLGGGGMVIWLGVVMFRTRAEVVERGKDLPYNSVVAGVVTSVLSPAVFLWWAIIGSTLVMNSLSFGTAGLILLIIVHVICDVVWLSLVSVLVWRTHSLLSKRFQNGLFIGCSLLLIGFGVYFITRGFQLLAQIV